MSEYQINKELWSKQLKHQMIKCLKLGRQFYSSEKRELSISVEKQKYFALRVPDLEEAERNEIQLIDFSKMVARGLCRAIEKDIVGFIGDNFFGESSCADSLQEALEFIHNGQIVFFGVEDIDVQSAYDLDCLSHRVVGRYAFKIGITK